MSTSAPAEHFRGKSILATGAVKGVEGVPRIEIDEAEQVRVAY